MFLVPVFFSLNTPPGTKVKLLGTVQVKNGLLLLDDSKISVLGGEVDHMVEKWELQRVSLIFIVMNQLLLQGNMGFICWQSLQIFIKDQRQAVVLDAFFSE